MQKTGLKTEQFANLLPSVQFVLGEDFGWSSATRTITHRLLAAREDEWLLLHEVGHALLNHRDYQNDLELIHHERAAWNEAQRVQARHPSLLTFAIDEECIEDHLDTYREWLFARSTCPGCHLTGMQVDHLRYECLNCHATWRVNEARVCRLRRQRLH